MNTVRYFDGSARDLDLSHLSSAEAKVLRTVNSKVAAGGSLAEVMDFLFEQTRSAFPCDRIGLAFVEEGGARLVSHWVRASYEPLRVAAGYAEDLRGSSLEGVIERRAVRVIDDLVEYWTGKSSSRSSRLLVEEGVRSSMTCPLIVEERVVGVLFRSSRRPGAYDEREVALHLAIAERLSQAVEKATLIEQLQKANGAYLETLAFVSHEIRNPLAGIVMDGHILTGGYQGELAPKQREVIERMVRKAKFLGALVREYLDLARIESGGLELDSQPEVDLVSDVVEPAIQLMAAELSEKGNRVVRFFPEARVALSCDPKLLGIVMVNLLGNASKYGNDGGEIRVRVEERETDVIVAVWNEGPGFPESERQRLFRKFSRLQTPELLRRKGTGVGLYSSWRIVQLHGGTMDACSQPGAWAEFSFSIPRLSVGR